MGSIPPAWPRAAASRRKGIPRRSRRALAIRQLAAIRPVRAARSAAPALEPANPPVPAAQRGTVCRRAARAPVRREAANGGARTASAETTATGFGAVPQNAPDRLAATFASGLGRPAPGENRIYEPGTEGRLTSRRSESSSSHGSFVVQVRQEPLLPQSDVAINTAVAVNVNGDRVGVYVKEPSFLVINDALTSEGELLRRLPHGGTVRRHGVSVEIEWPDGSRLTTIQFGPLLNYALAPSARVAPSLSGLLSSADRSPSHSFVSRDSSALSAGDSDFPIKLYQQFGNSWRIRQSESLFHYWPGENSARFTDPQFPRKRVTAATLAQGTRSRAETICRAVGVTRRPTLDDCILDVGVSGTPAIAAASLSAARSATPFIGTTQPQPTLAAKTSSSPALGADTYAIKIGDTVATDRPAPGAGRV